MSKLDSDLTVKCTRKFARWGRPHVSDAKSKLLCDVCGSVAGEFGRMYTLASDKVECDMD